MNTNHDRPPSEEQTPKREATLGGLASGELLARMLTLSHADGQKVSQPAIANGEADALKGQIPPGLESFHPKVQESAKTVPTDTKPPVRKAPTFHPYVRGKLCMALALGLSYREVAAWFDMSKTILDRLVELDPTFKDEVVAASSMVMLQPLLRIQKASQQSWQAAAWLNQFLNRRQGKLETDELLGMYPELSLKLRQVLYPDEFLPAINRRRRRT